MKFQLIFLTCGLLLLAVSFTHGRNIDEDKETSAIDFGGLISQTLHNGVQDILAKFKDDGDDNDNDDNNDSSAASSKAAISDEQLEKENVEEEEEEDEEKPSSSSQEATIVDNLTAACTRVETLLQGAVTKLQRSFRNLMESLLLEAAGNGDDMSDKDDKKDDKQKKQKAQRKPAAEEKEQHKRQNSDKQADKVSDSAGLMQGADKATKPDATAASPPSDASDSAAGVDVAKALGTGQQTDDKDGKVGEDDAGISE